MMLRVKRAREQLLSEYPFAFIVGDVFSLMAYWGFFFVLSAFGWKDWVSALLSLPVFIFVTMIAKLALSVRSFPEARWIAIPGLALFLAVVALFFALNGASALFVGILVSMAASSLLSLAILGW